MNSKVSKILIGLLLVTVALQASCTNAGVPPTVTPQPTATETPHPTATSTAPPTATAVPTATATAPPSPTRQPSPSADIAPTQGPPGTEIQVAAEGFPPNTTVEVGLGVKNTEYWNSQDVRTDAAGAMNTAMTIPPSAEPGEHWVAVVRVVRRGGAKAISEDFVVSQPAAKFTQVDIYLIALGDEGRTGQEIGCGDSVLPVEVEIEPTVAPLTAALEELLALGEQEYGRSGLYNALYRSDLALESVDIEAGEAIIYLSGEISLGGACDIPRVQAQIEETALQFSTVDQVSVFVNGDALEQVLSSQ
jgi:hypothetical protein